MLVRALTKGSHQLALRGAALAPAAQLSAALGTLTAPKLAIASFASLNRTWAAPSTTLPKEEFLSQHLFHSVGPRCFSAAQPQHVEQDEVKEETAAANEADAAKGDGPSIAPHRGLQGRDASQGTYWLMQPVYTEEYVRSVAPRHKEPTNFRERVAYGAVQVMRRTFDFFTGYKTNGMTEAKWMQRILFLETVAGVPGMVAGMLRHMRSLRSMSRDNGWIHTLLEEAENERMHLLTFLQIRQPGVMFRGMVLLGQGVFFNSYLLAYIVSPRTCHAFVGYLEEEAVKTYTHAIADLRAGKLKAWEDLKAPDVAVKYWKMREGANMLDLLLQVRADEACHSHVNHTFSDMKPSDTNPFQVGSHSIA